jgi:hypothetical protein
MSEQLRASHESHEKIDDAFFEAQRKAAEHERAGKTPEASNSEKSIESILSTIEKTAKTTEELSKHQDTAENRPSHTQLKTGHHLRQHGYTQTMKRVQKQLPPTQRTLSKIIHNPAVDAVSTVAGETVARPSGLLSGALFSIIANLLIIGICRYYGYEYNYLIGLLGFVGGFVVGLFVELVYRATTKNRSR